MKKQDKAFISKRDKVRKALYMKRLCDTGQAYRKLMNLNVNGKINSPLNDKEVLSLSKSIDDVLVILKDFKDELHR